MRETIGYLVGFFAEFAEPGGGSGEAQPPPVASHAESAESAEFETHAESVENAEPKSHAESAGSAERIPLSHVLASEIVEQIERMEAESGRGDGLAIRAEERTNSILFSGPDSDLEFVRDCVGRLDVPQTTARRSPSARLRSPQRSTSRVLARERRPGRHGWRSRRPRTSQ